MTSKINYKFKSSLNFDTVFFEGDSILVKEFNSIIKNKCGFGSIDYDLKLQDNNGKHYVRDEESIPAFSNIIICRIPKMRCTTKRLPENVSKMVTPVAKLINKLESQSVQPDIPSSVQTAANNNDSFASLCNSLGKPPFSYVCHKCNLSGDHWMQFCDTEKSSPSVDIKNKSNQSLLSLLSFLDNAASKHNKVEDCLPKDDVYVTEKAPSPPPPSDPVPNSPIPNPECVDDPSPILSPSPSCVSCIASPTASCEFEIGSPNYSDASSIITDRICSDSTKKEAEEEEEEIVQDKSGIKNDVDDEIVRDPKLLSCPVPTTFLCPVCNKILRDAVLVRCCTATFCRSCISSEHGCPNCKTKILTSTKEGNILDNVVVRKMIQEWQLKMLASPNEPDTIQGKHSSDLPVCVADADSVFSIEEAPMSTAEKSFTCQYDPVTESNSFTEKEDDGSVVIHANEITTNEQGHHSDDDEVGSSVEIDHKEKPEEEVDTTDLERTNSPVLSSCNAAPSQNCKENPLNGFPVPVLPLSTNIHQSNQTYSLYNYYLPSGTYTGNQQDHGFVGTHNQPMPPTHYDMQSYAMAGVPPGLIYPSTSAANYPSYPNGWNHIMTSVPPPGYDASIRSQMCGAATGGGGGMGHYRLPTDSTTSNSSNFLDRYNHGSRQSNSSCKQSRYGRSISNYKTWSTSKEGLSNQAKTNSNSSVSYDKEDSKKHNNYGGSSASKKMKSRYGEKDALIASPGNNSDNSASKVMPNNSSDYLDDSKRHRSKSGCKSSCADGEFDSNEKSSEHCRFVDRLENQPFSPALYIKCMKVLFKTNKPKFEELFGSTIGYRIEGFHSSERDEPIESDSESSQSELDVLSSVVASQSLTRLNLERSKLSISPKSSSRTTESKPHPPHNLRASASPPVTGLSRHRFMKHSIRTASSSFYSRSLHYRNDQCIKSSHHQFQRPKLSSPISRHSHARSSYVSRKNGVGGFPYKSLLSYNRGSLSYRGTRGGSFRFGKVINNNWRHPYRNHFP